LREVGFEQLLAKSAVQRCSHLASPKEENFFSPKRRDRQSVIYVGAKTGREAFTAIVSRSAEFAEESQQKRPNVQVGDHCSLENCFSKRASKGDADRRSCRDSGIWAPPVSLLDHGNGFAGRHRHRN